GPHREDLLGGRELDPPQHAPLFARLIAVVEGVAVVQRLRKQFGVLLVHRRQVLPILRHIGHAFLIVRFTRKRHTDMFVATGWGTLLRLCVAHHCIVWRIFEPPSPLLFPLFHQPQNPLEPEEFRLAKSLAPNADCEHQRGGVYLCYRSPRIGLSFSKSTFSSRFGLFSVVSSLNQTSPY